MFNPAVSFSFKLVTVDDVHRALNSITTNARGNDEITSRMLKYCSPYVDRFITHIINCCIEQSYFPDCWKTAIGIPLAKIANPLTFSDLRIISILPILSKVFEKLLATQMHEFVSINGVLPGCQCGFRKGYSTAVALATVTDDIIRARDSGKYCALVLLDYSRVNELAVRMLESYMGGPRKFFVIITSLTLLTYMLVYLKDLYLVRYCS